MTRNEEYDNLTVNGPMDAQSVNTNQIHDSTGRYLGELTGTADGSTVNDAITDRQSGAHVIVPDPGFELALEETIVLPENEEDGFRLETIGNPRFQVQGGFTASNTVACGIRKPEDTSTSTTPQDRRDYYIGPLVIDDRGTFLLDWAIETNDMGKSIIEGLFANRCQGIKVNDGQEGSARVHARDCHVTLLGLASNGVSQPTGYTVTEDNNQYSNDQFFTRCTAGGGNDAGTTLFDWQAGGEHKAWQCGGENFERVAIIDGVGDYLFDEGDIDSASLVNGCIEERNGASGELRLKNSTWGGNGPLWKKIRLNCPDTTVTLKGTSPDLNHGRGLTDYAEPIHQATQSVAIPDGIYGWEGGTTGDSEFNKFFGGGRDPHLQFNMDAGTGANDSVVFCTAYGAGSSQFLFEDPYWPLFQVGEMSPNLDTEQIVIRVGFAANTTQRGGGSDYAELVYDPQNVISTADHSNGNWYFEVQTDSTFRGSVDTGVSNNTVGNVAVKSEPEGFASTLGAGQGSAGATWHTVGNGGQQTTTRFGPRIYFETLESNTSVGDKRLSVRLGYGFSMRAL